MIGKRKRISKAGYDLHTPKGLTPLAIRPKSDREEVLADEGVQSLRETKELLLTNACQDFLAKGIERNSLVVRQSDWGAGADRLFASCLLSTLWQKDNRSFSDNVIQWSDVLGKDEPENPWAIEFRETSRERRNQWVHYLNDYVQRESKQSTEVNDFLVNFSKKSNEFLLKQREHASNDLEELVDQFEADHKISLAVSTPLVLYVCPDCRAVVSEGKFRKDKCSCGHEIVRPSKVEKVSLCQIRPAVISFYRENMWLEEGVAYQFKRLNFEPTTGCNILGSSGIWHEIDVLAEAPTRGIRTACECKNRKLVLGDVYVFHCKLRDIGISRGILVSTIGETAGDVLLAAEPNGIKICSSALDKSADEWRATLS